MDITINYITMRCLNPQFKKKTEFPGGRKEQVYIGRIRNHGGFRFLRIHIVRHRVVEQRHPLKF
jgi:hypothetical protein